jgi:hypothetical protein
MKKINFTFLLLSIIVVLSCKKTEEDITPKDFVSYYSFDGNTNDSKGNLSSIINYRAKLATDKNAKENSAYFFDGNAYLELPVPSAKNVFTYSIWASPSSVGFSGYLGVVFSVGSQGGDQLISIANNYFGGTGWSLTSYNSDGTLLNANSTGLPSINTWYHLVISRNEESFRAYVNGKLIGLVTANGKKPGYGSDQTKFYIGSRHSTQSFVGSIDELKVFDRVLTDDEVKALYTSY